MSTRRTWIFAGVGLSLLALTVVGTVALAGESDLGLSSNTQKWVWGQDIELQVEVHPMLVGGSASLMMQVQGRAPTPTGAFELHAPSFPITRTLPSNPEYAGLRVSFWYDANAPWGEAVGGSDTVRKKPKPPIEWE